MCAHKALHCAPQRAALCARDLLSAASPEPVKLVGEDYSKRLVRETIGNEFKKAAESDPPEDHECKGLWPKPYDVQEPGTCNRGLCYHEVAWLAAGREA